MMGMGVAIIFVSIMLFLVATLHQVRTETVTVTTPYPRKELYSKEQQSPKGSFLQLDETTVSPFSSPKQELREVSGEISTHAHNVTLPRYLTDSICRGCRFALGGSHGTARTCQAIILARLRKKEGSQRQTREQERNWTTTSSHDFLDAAREIARERPDFCGHCHPDACTDIDKRYWRFDAAAPPPVQSVTHHLSSIAKSHRLPADTYTNWTDYASQPQNVYPQKTHLFEFNPSICILPSSQVPMDLPKAVYLASFRVSSQHNCIADNAVSRLLMGGSSRPADKEYLGLALLDKDLQILRETIIDAVPTMHRLQDARLFALKGQIYVASYHRIFPIWIVPPLHTSFETVVHHSMFQKNEGNMPVTFRKFAACTADRATQKGGKNLNYFVDAHKRTVLELEPMGRKEVVNMNSKCQKTPRNHPHPLTILASQRKAATFPEPSFATMDELLFGTMRQLETKPPYTGDRGSACCVTMQHPHTNEVMLLGIAHSKTRYNHKNNNNSANHKGGIAANHFFSSFYAMKATAPYRVVARTGNFCWGFANSPKGTKYGNPYTQLQPDALHVLVKFHQCPRIHFVSGMTLKADDPSKLIVTYGINDCVPRMVVVDMNDILRMLFEPAQMA